MIDVIQGVGIFIIFLIIFYLTYDTNINRLNYVDNKKKRTISFLSYNVKRLTLKNKSINFINWDNDIVCLQEYYNDMYGKKNLIYINQLIIILYCLQIIDYSEIPV